MSRREGRIEVEDEQATLVPVTGHCTLRATLIILGVAFLTLAGVSISSAQTFFSGSTGVDGAFNPTCSPTPCTVTVSLPVSGLFNYTTITVPTGVTVRYTPNTANTPVTLLATGNVTIAGTIDVSGTSGGDGAPVANATPNAGAGGPGGFSGGQGANGAVTGPGGAGLGPGGGGSGRPGGGGGFGAPGWWQGTAGQPYGYPTLIPMIGGSGGGGGDAWTFGPVTKGGGGGGGAGAIVIASSGTISLTGALLARGGGGGNLPNNNISPCGPGGAGSGGAVRLVATTLDGTGTIDVSGGVGGFPNYGCPSQGGNGGAGRIRLEAFTGNWNFGFVGSSAYTEMARSVSQPLVVALTNAPTLRITHVAGLGVPANPLGSYTTPDLTLPTSTASPLSVTLAASNIPLGTTVRVAAKPYQGGSSETTSTSLTGSVANSTATATVSIPMYNEITLITASATFTLVAEHEPTTLVASDERIEAVHVWTVLGGPSNVAYRTRSGRLITESGGMVVRVIPTAAP